MERQTKHRILGILVVIGLVIILLPLFQGGKEMSTETALAKSPPFPDQTTQTMVAAIPDAAVPVQPAVAEQALAAPKPADNPVNQVPDDIISSTHPSVINTTVAEAQSLTPPSKDEIREQPKAAQSTFPSESVKTVSAEPEAGSTKIQLSHGDIVKSEMLANKSSVSDNTAASSPEPVKTSNYRIIEGEKAAALLKKSPRLSKNGRSSTKAQSISSVKLPVNHTLKSALKAPLEDDGLIKLKSAVWVIQVGSFKNKANALRVANQLRENGYRAFIQQISTAMGENTRVFVGPEIKRTTARELADRLQKEMHIQGIVISYKPLTL